MSNRQWGRWIAAITIAQCAVAAVAADECSAVADAVVNELRAGVAASVWNDDTAALVRLSAASACVKARSARYQHQETLMQAPVSAPPISSVEPASSSTALTPADPAVAEADPDKAGDSGKEAEETGLTFRPLSGSPSKKPYERRRVKDD